MLHAGGEGRDRNISLTNASLYEERSLKELWRKSDGERATAERSSVVALDSRTLEARLRLLA